MSPADIKYKWLLISLFILICSLENHARFIEVYKDNHGFKKEQPFQRKTFKKS